MSRPLRSRCLWWKRDSCRVSPQGRYRPSRCRHDSGLKLPHPRPALRRPVFIHSFYCRHFRAWMARCTGPYFAYIRSTSAGWPLSSPRLRREIQVRVRARRGRRTQLRRVAVAKLAGAQAGSRQNALERTAPGHGPSYRRPSYRRPSYRPRWDRRGNKRPSPTLTAARNSKQSTA